MPRFDGWATVEVAGRVVLVDLSDLPVVMGYGWTISPMKDTAYVVRGGSGPDEPRTVYLHRQLLGLRKGDRLEVDHIDGNGLDNRRSNMRVVTHAQNLQNQRKHAGCTSKYRGVCWSKRRREWVVGIKLHGRRAYTAYFKDEDRAGQAAAEWRAKHMPFSADAREKSA